MVVDEEIIPYYVKHFEFLEKHYISVINYYYHFKLAAKSKIIVLKSIYFRLVHHQLFTGSFI